MGCATAAPAPAPAPTATAAPTSPRHEGNLTRLVQIGEAPTIDGLEDPVWQVGDWNPIDNLIKGKVDAPSDSGGEWKGLWTATHFFLFVRVRDDKELREGPGHSYLDDQIELFITGDDRKPASYFKPKATNTFAYEDPRGGPTTETHKETTGLRSAYAESESGWTLELAVPFSGKNHAQTGWNGRVCCVGADPRLQGSARFEAAPASPTAATAP
jgi:hypothetical protein